LEEVAVGAGADGVIDCLAQAVLDPGDEIVCGWPSFPSYVIYATKLGATPVKVPLRDHRYDLEALLAAVTPRTKLVYVCNPNNPTGTMNTRAELDAYFDRVADHVLTVVDQAYFEYIDDPEYPDAISEHFRGGRRVLVVRTFSKIYGLAGLRVGYGVGPAELVAAMSKVRRAFDITTQAQEAAIVSIDDRNEIARRRAANREGREQLEQIVGKHGFETAQPAVANFVFADAGGDAQSLFDALLREGVIVRPLAGFGAADAVRITVGTRDEQAFLDEALARVKTAAGAS
jgi:histidinol-phosphate aminotransferase